MASAFRFVREDTAFANGAVGKQTKRKREKDDAHLAFIRRLPCIISGKMPVDAAHIRFGDPVYGKRETGMGEKADDKWTVPLHRSIHTDGPDAQHGQNERLFWTRHGIDPLRVAAALYANSGDDDQGRMILSEARNTARTMLWPASANPETHDGE